MHIEPSEKQIQLTSKLRKRLSDVHSSAGYIAGWESDEEIVCAGVASTSEHFLLGLKVVGFFCRVHESLIENGDLLSISEQNYGILKLELENAVAIFVSKSKDSDEASITVKLYSPYYRTLSALNVTDLSITPGVLLRARGYIPIVYEITSDADSLKENIDSSIEKLRASFQNQAAAFLLQNSRVILHSSQELEEAETCKYLLKLSQEGETSDKHKTKKNAKTKVPLNFDILLQASGEIARENVFNHSVVIHCQRREFKCATLELPLDIIVVCQESSSIDTMHKLLVSAIEQHLLKINQCLFKCSSDSIAVSPQTYHFYPDTFDFPITVIYPSNKTDDELEQYRKDIHKELLLPMDRPYFKKLQAHDFSSVNSSGHLFNPHEGINTGRLPGGKTAIVYGKYSYHHYMQDHMNDDGWGCAYRSLQTIISWFKCQGYTDRSIPTHKEIQQALVDIGDKQPSFIGSRQWIGSQEVSFCLDHLIKVESKILCVSSGAEMANKGRELLNHFQEQGTPIMIGGGVLAHTILGVDYNSETGDLKFLILDPHYTGNEDIGIILNKGWCGWKGTNFWDQTAFYNLCLPQRPQQI